MKGCGVHIAIAFTTAPLGTVLSVVCVDNEMWCSPAHGLIMLGTD